MFSWWLFPPLDNPQPGLRGASACLWQKLSVPLLLSWTLSPLKTHSLTWCLHSTAHKLGVTPQVWSPQHIAQILRFQALASSPSLVCFNEKLCLFMEGNRNAILPKAAASFIHAYMLTKLGHRMFSFATRFFPLILRAVKPDVVEAEESRTQGQV